MNVKYFHYFVDYLYMDKQKLGQFKSLSSKLLIYILDVSKLLHYFEKQITKKLMRDFCATMYSATCHTFFSFIKSSGSEIKLELYKWNASQSSLRNPALI